MTKALTLDEARDALKMAAVEFVSDFAYRRQSAHDLVGPLEALIDAKIAIARQEIAALSDGDRTRAEDARVPTSTEAGNG